MTPLAGWGEFAAAFLAFFVTHSVPVRPAIKARLARWLSATGFSVAYSALSIAVLAWVIGAAARAPYVELWQWALWQNKVTFCAMGLSGIVAALGIGRPNPLSFGGARNELYDPDNAGIVGWARHPLLLALLLWSVGHIVPNGDLAHLILFGVFAGFSLLGMRLIDRRKKRALGEAAWRRLANAKRHITLTRAGAFRAAVAVICLVALLYLHGPVIGVAPQF